MTDRWPWHARPHDAFGRALVDPATLPHDARLDELRRVAGRLAADSDLGVQWLAGGLLAWCARGVPLADALGVRPPRGCTRTVAHRARQAARDDALLQLAAALGCDRRALRVLRGDESCPPDARALLDAARAAGAPSGHNAVARARRRVTASMRMRW